MTVKPYPVTDVNGRGGG